MLDKNKPKCTIYGIHEARYEQDGELFRADGSNIKDPPIKKEPEKKPVEKPKETVTVIGKQMSFEEKLEITDWRDNNYINKEKLKVILDGSQVPYKPTESRGSLIEKVKAL